VKIKAMRAKIRGFTLVDLLIVVAIIGLLAAIAIPALTSSIQRARQKRTMAELRAIATAVSSYATDYPFMPKVGPGTADILVPYLVPTYVRHLTGLDGWQHLFYYEADEVSYTLKSFGSDGLAQSSLAFGPTTNFSDDIVISNGVFVQWPDGMQTN
jgi:type II secretion system protein G